MTRRNLPFIVFFIGIVMMVGVIGFCVVEETFSTQTETPTMVEMMP